MIRCVADHSFLDRGDVCQCVSESEGLVDALRPAVLAGANVAHSALICGRCRIAVASPQGPLRAW